MNELMIFLLLFTSLLAWRTLKFLIYYLRTKKPILKSMKALPCLSLVFSGRIFYCSTPPLSLRTTEIFWAARLFWSFSRRNRCDLFHVKHVLIYEPLEKFSNEFCSTKIKLTVERFHTRGQHLCKFIWTKESIQIRKSSIPTGFVSKT